MCAKYISYNLHQAKINYSKHTKLNIVKQTNKQTKNTHKNIVSFVNKYLNCGKIEEVIIVKLY